MNKKIIRAFVLLIFSSQAGAYQIADITFVLGDAALLEEIGAIEPRSNNQDSEKAKLKERIEFIISVLAYQKTFPQLWFNKKKNQIISNPLGSLVASSDFSYQITFLNDDEALQMAVFMSSYLSSDSEKKEYGCAGLKSVIELEDKDVLDAATLTKKLVVLKD